MRTKKGEDTVEHKGTVRLETERLVLRRFVLDDAENMYKNWGSQEEVTRYLTWSVHDSVDVTRAILRSWLEDYEREDCYAWAMELKELGEVIGSISVVALHPGTESVELGYCMGRRWWGQELMPEAVRAVERFLFEEGGCLRIAAAHDRDNPKSGRVMEKAGMSREGTLRASGRNNRGIVDMVWYSILRQEYEEKKS